MLKLEVNIEEFFDEETSTFMPGVSCTLNLEHSLVALSKWESILNKSFLSTPNKTATEIRLYIQCMVMNEVDLNVVDYLTAAQISQINDYIEADHTATTFSAQRATGTSEIVTVETVYFWMTNFNIWLECQHWHLNRLMALIRMASLKNSTQKKMSPSEAARRQRDLNEQRLAKLKTKG